MIAGIVGSVVVIFLILFVVISIYNSLVGMRNEYKNAFAQIDVQLKRRHDLIPNLVETAKKFMEHERSTLEAVIQARNQAVTQQKRVDQDMNSETVGGLLAAESVLTGAMGKFLALSESYPELKSDSTMKNLMEELSSTENKIAFARQHYNDSVMLYNTKREIFPNSMIAGAFHFEAAKPWLIEDVTEREVPKVSF